MHVVAMGFTALLLFAVLWLLLRNQLLVFVPDVQGTWDLETITEESRSQRCIGAHLWWVVHLIQSGQELSGYGRMVSEQADAGSVDDVDRDGARFTLLGEITKRLFAADMASIRVDARGLGVESDVILYLEVARGGGMVGRFMSTGGDGSGVVRFVRAEASLPSSRNHVGA